MIRYGHKTGLTATHECCGDGTWYVMISEDEMRNTLGTAADVVPLSLCFIHTLVRKLLSLSGISRPVNCWPL